MDKKKMKTSGWTTQLISKTERAVDDLKEERKLQNSLKDLQAKLNRG